MVPLQDVNIESIVSQHKASRFNMDLENEFHLTQQQTVSEITREGERETE